MADWIIIPDVHGRPFWRDAVKGHEEDRIIFLGDYVDPYSRESITPWDAFQELLDIIEFRKAHPDNAVLLLGNHDLGYLDSSICTCRMAWNLHEEIGRTLEENLDLFDITHTEQMNGGKVLFSHAGIAENWVRQRQRFVGKPEEFRPERLNEMLHGEKPRRALLFMALSDVSWFRGGTAHVGSPVWADVQEYLEGERLLEGYTHVFGHTLHRGGPVSVRDRGFCLDCARAFRVRVDEKGTTECNNPGIFVYI